MASKVEGEKMSKTISAAYRLSDPMGDGAGDEMMEETRAE